MTNSKAKMTASYKAIFIISIFMFFFVLIVGAATGSKSSGIGIWVWGYTVWLMYKRRDSDLVSFFKVILWFDVIAAVVALAVLAFGGSDVSRYVGYSVIEAVLLFASAILITYGLYKYFCNFLLSNSGDLSTNGDPDSSLWEQVSEEIKAGKSADSLWVRAFSETDGDSNKANARYIKLRFEQLKSENSHFSKSSNSRSPVKNLTRSTNFIYSFWSSLNIVGQLWRPLVAMTLVIVVSNIAVQFPINQWLTWGAFTYPFVFLVADLTNRAVGAQAARRVAWLGLLPALLLSAWFANWHIALASGTAFILSQWMDIAVFNRWRSQSWWKAPFMGSVVASVVDTLVFFSIAFYASEMNWMMLAAGDLAMKWLMAVLLLAPYRLMLPRIGLWVPQAR